MVAPVIALGVYELLAAGVAATGLGAFAVAKRRELAEGLNDAATAAQDVFRETTIQALPYIIGTVTGHNIWRPRALPEVTDVGPAETLPLPRFADAGAWDSIGVPQFPAIPVGTKSPVGDVLPVVRRLPDVVGVPLPPAGGPPEDPFQGVRRWLDCAKETTTRIAQNPWVRGAGVLYKWYVYGSTVLFMAEVGRRTFIADPKQTHGPILYDYFYEPAFGASTAVRTFLGGHQVMSAETAAGMLAVELAKRLVPGGLGGRLSAEFVEKFLKHLPTFGWTHAFAALGSLPFIEHQMTATNSEIQNVDFDRATRTATFYGFTSIAYFPIKDWLINLPMFGRVGFREWWMRWGAERAPTLVRAVTSTDGMNWLGAQFLRGVEACFGKRAVQWVAPHYIPKLQTIGVYALFATAYRNTTQAIASSAIFEDSDRTESLKMTNLRSMVSTMVFDPYFYLGARSNSMRSLVGNQAVFMGMIYYFNQYFSPFDGKDVAVSEADRALKVAFANGEPALLQATLSKPLTQRNFAVPPQTDLSVKTWAELTRQYADHEILNPTLVAALMTTMRSHLKSKESGERRVGMALGVLLSQVALTADSVSKTWSGWRVGLAAILEQDGVRIHPRHAGRPLDADELNRVFEDINAGLYDESPLFQFPRN